jgi:lysophospholipase L1-like esterase
MVDEYNTGNPVPSSAMPDAWDNNATIDGFVNSTGLTVITRTGIERDTMAGMQKKADDQRDQMAADGAAVVEETRQNLIPLSRQYMTLAAAQADIANIPEGSTTYYRSPDDSALAIEVINNGGTLEATGRKMPSDVTIDNKLDKRIPLGAFSSSFFPAWFDSDGNVPAWFDKSRFDAADLGPVLRAVVENIPNAWAQYNLRQMAFSSSFFPAWFDSDGNVPAWFDKSRFDAAGLGPNIQSLIKNLVGVNSSESFIEGDQYKFNFKRGRIAAGQSASLNVAFTGDSWTEKNTIPKSLISILGGTYKDPGWISCSTRTDGVMAGITLATNGFTKYDGDNENTGAAPPYGSGPDGNGYYNNNAVGTLTWSNVRVTDLSVFYYDGSGTFTISVDGTVVATITGHNTGASMKHDIAGMASSAHTVVITSSGTGVVSILGMYGKNGGVSSGVTVSRMGNGGAMASDFVYWQNWIEPVAANLDIDLLFIILGTNDFRKSAGTDEYTNGIQMIIDKYKASTPGICICLVSPAQSNASGTPLLSEYDKAMRTLAVDNNVNFISLYQLFPKAYDNSGGAWVDSLHMSSLGAYVLARKIKDEFFQE